jgi:hypothetical protein
VPIRPGGVAYLALEGGGRSSGGEGPAVGEPGVGDDLGGSTPGAKHSDVVCRRELILYATRRITASKAMKISENLGE